MDPYFIIDVSCLSLLCCLVCSLQPCDHLNGLYSWLTRLLYFHAPFVTFPYGVLGQVWYLIVSIPDLCLTCILVGPDFRIFPPLLTGFIGRVGLDIYTLKLCPITNLYYNV